MWKCSVVVLLLPLMVVNRAHLRQTSPALLKTNWYHGEHETQVDLLGSWQGSSLNVESEAETDDQSQHGPLRRTARSTKDLHSACDCFKSDSLHQTGCKHEIAEYGLVINGRCFTGTQRRRRRSTPVKSDVPFEFPDSQWCEGTLPLLLVSSGEQQSLHLSNVPSVWVCPGSLGSPLQQLAITDVPEVSIAPGALFQRFTDFTLNLTGVSKTLVFPPEAFSVDLVEVRNVDNVPAGSIDNNEEHSLPPEVKILILNANFVKFESKSVLAPRVRVEVQQAEKLEMETNSVQALAHSYSSALHVSLTRSLFMETRAAIVNSLRVINTSTVLLKEESLNMEVPGGEVILQNVGDVMLPERGIIVGGEAALALTNVSLTPRGRRALLSTSPLGLAVLRSVTVAGTTSASICLDTHLLTLDDVTMAPSEHHTASACVRFVTGMENRTEIPGAVLCKTSGVDEAADPRLCADPRCTLCSPRPTVTIQSTPPPIQLLTAWPETPSSVSTHSGFTHAPGSAVSSGWPGTEPSGDVKRSWWEEPKYLGPVVALAVLVLLLLLSCCLYRLRRHSKSAKYELPQTFRHRTFPRTIITPATLNTAPPGHPLHAAPAIPPAAELFVSYHVSHGLSLQPGALAEQYSRHNGRSASDLDATWKKNHQRDPCLQHSSLKTHEEDNSLSSSEITI